ncbi:hypothetical protein [Nonomuraea sp. NPDC052265]|uniref:hypothetical protein n=1 Tax=Nonomuraea sp. NPDC052265 TaxID=3364374 RepID=UPI0037CB46DC
MGYLPVFGGTLIRLKVEYLPGERDSKPLWLWNSAISITAARLDRLWQAFLRKFDLEHTFSMFKQTLGGTLPVIRSPHAADLWTWLVIVAHPQLRLAARSRSIFAALGRVPVRVSDIPLPASAEGFATSADGCHCPPVHGN